MTERESLAQAKVRCPLCDGVHERCEFGKGLYCMRPNCRNPHHRRRPEEDKRQT